MNSFSENAVLILGKMFPRENEKEVIEKSKGMVSTAASAHLEKLVLGIQSAFGGDSDIKMLNVMPVSSYPLRYTSSRIEETHFSVGSVDNNINVGFLNVTVIKNLSIQHSLDRHAEEWVRQTEGKRRFVIAYTMNEIFLKTCAKIKKHSPDCHVCVIVPDLPAYTDLDKSGLKAMIYKPIIKRRIAVTNKLSENADSFVFLTRQMAEYFPVKRPYIVSEAVAPLNSEKDNTAVEITRDNDIKTIAYTGSFTIKYGVLDLVNAFEKIKSKNIHLVICGSGEAYDIIKEKSEHDSRIIFKGTVTHDEALKIQQEADILVNPRGNDGEYTKYSFPSKIMEYMAAAKPVICFKLDGIPDEYDEYLTYFTDVDSMANVIENECKKTHEELRIKGKRSAEFVMKHKTPIQFGERLREMVTKKRILISSDDLCIGGTTTSLLSLLRLIDTNRFSVDLVTPNNNGELFGEIPPYINILPPSLEQSRIKRGLVFLLRGYLARRFVYRKTRGKRYPLGMFQLMSGQAAVAASRRINRFYDIAIGYMEGYPDNYILKKVRAAKKIMYIHVNYEAAHLDPKMDKNLYCNADKVAVVSADCKSAVEKLFPECVGKVEIVENPISSELVRSMAENDISEEKYAEKCYFNIVTTARLVNSHKAIDRAVRACERLKQICSVPIKWYIFGEGEDKEKIQTLIHVCKAENECILMGKRSNVYPYIKKADLFVLPSRFEGKPMCVTEAQILGCVPLVTEYNSAREQIQSGVNGVICENSDGDVLAETIKRVILEPRKLYEMRRELKEHDYSTDLSQFYDLIDEN